MLRSRWVVVLLTASTTLLALAVAAHAGPATHVSAQGTDDAETEGETDGEEGQSEPEAEAEAGEEGSEPAETETGPPWTYQMARIGLVLLVFLGLAIGAAYYRFVASRQRGAA